MQQRKPGAPWRVCGVIALVVVCVGALVLTGGIGALAFLGQDPAGLSVMINPPSDVVENTQFRLVIHLSNTGRKALTVSKIEFPEEMLAQALISSVDPVSTGGGGAVYEFSLLLQPGQAQDITFTMQALRAGTVSGDVDVFVGPRFKITSMVFPIAERAVVPAATAVVVAETLQPAIDDIAGVPYKAVVQIIALIDLDGERVPGWTGSGSIISKDGLVLTNAHVVLSDRYYQVQELMVALTLQADAQPQPAYYARVMQVDEALDIAVIRIETNLDGSPVDRASLNLPVVEMGSSEALRLGDPLTILGYPTIGGSTITLTRGEVAGFTAEEAFGSRAFIKTSATISGGNSGGLAANATGQLIGIPTQLGYGGEDQYVDCRVLADTNRDGIVNDNDNCVPTGGFINALRPLSLAQPLIDAAARGEINIQEGVQGQQSELPQEQASGVLFSDDFTDPTSGWDDSAWEQGAVRYENGEYWITVNEANWLVWSYHLADTADLMVRVDTRIVQPTGVGDYGILCRYTDAENFYALEVSEDGYFTIWKKFAGETISLYDWTFSESIPIGTPFQVNAGCVGDRLSLGVNDVLLAEITDPSLTNGRYGLVAGTLDVTGFVIAFDNFVVLQP